MQIVLIIINIIHISLFSLVMGSMRRTTQRDPLGARVKSRAQESEVSSQKNMVDMPRSEYLSIMQWHGKTSLTREP